MLSSVRKHLNIPIQIHNFLDRDGAGDKTFNTPVDTMCYAMYEVKVHTDPSGTEVVSTITLYLDGTENIGSDDEVLFESHIRPVKALGSFYKYGQRDLWVVYV